MPAARSALGDVTAEQSLAHPLLVVIQHSSACFTVLESVHTATDFHADGSAAFAATHDNNRSPT